jgi:N-terminal half of MaoC dehydratase
VTLDARDPEVDFDWLGPPFVWTPDHERAREFARACAGDPAIDPDVKSPPPTFAEVGKWSCDRADLNEPLAEAFEPLRTLHGEQEYIYHRPLVYGVELLGLTRITEYSTKFGLRGGRMRVARYETVYRDRAGLTVLQAWNTLVETGVIIH